MNTRNEWLQSFENELTDFVKSFGFVRTRKHTWEKVREGIRFVVDITVDVPYVTHLNINYEVFTPPVDPSYDHNILAEACVGLLAGREYATYKLPYFMFRLRTAGGKITNDVENTFSWFSINFGTRRACLRYLEQSDMNHNCLSYKHNYRYLTETMQLGAFSDDDGKENSKTKGGV